MSFDGAIKALSTDALRFVKDGQVLGLGSGRAATAFVRSLSRHILDRNIAIRAVPTSLQIKLVAQQGGIPLVEADQAERIDIVFDGADQIDSQKNMIKGGGGALLQENILISAAKKVVIMADDSKFAKNLDMPVPVEVHPSARTTAAGLVAKLGGRPRLRLLDRGYPFVTENGGVILECDFGVIENPRLLRQKLVGLAGVLEAGIFTRKPDVIYRARAGGKFDVSG